MSKRALGRGIDALIQQVDDETPPEPKDVTTVQLRNIQPNPFQPRTEFDEERLTELAESIKQQGVIQPLIVEQDRDVYTIIAGERRFRAARMAGLSEVPVILRKFTDDEKLEIALIENIQREDLNPIEEAKAYRKLMERNNLSQDSLAKKIGKKRSTVANSMRLLKLPEDMQDSIVNGELSSGHARSILSVINPADQRILYNRILNEHLSVREAERQAAGFNKGIRSSEKERDKSSYPKLVPPEVQEIEQRFLDILGTKVALKGDMKKGKIEITYYSKEDLERVYDIITGMESS
ncbi:MAG: ParB/RepB/Spo0J family partition protein [Spirochaetaceae bacterium]|nr:ParB/RepB/Spo0J family partition protein [Spirochaetaceae bacterium]MCF7949653.1 ParB/RepB/Spo0J family partition protein [Spirochaetia bacterium]MCF7952053.1 ParB/RepB/Spo0J family partition protein [Spirochaetaceae bacterium]